MASKIAWQKSSDISKEESDKLTEIRLDGLTVLKIIKHCHEFSHEVTGSLVGLDIDNKLEVTNCFPYPTLEADSEESQSSLDDYQLEMLKMLRDVNVDNNCVGWYQSRFMGASCTAELVETQLQYQSDLGNKMVVIVYNPVRTMRGNLSLHAYRLSETFMKAHAKDKNFTQESLTAMELESSKILEEIPIKITNTPLNQALLYELRKNTDVKCRVNRLNLSINPVLEKELGELVTCVAELTEEQAKFQRYERDCVLQKQRRSNWLQERRLENAKRKEEGLEPLPENEPSNPVFKNIPEPSRLQSLLVGKQIHTYCDQINRFAGNSFSKIFLAGSLHKD